MDKGLFTAVHNHRHGTSHYVFTMDVKESTGPVLPEVEVVVKMFDIDYEPELEETIDIEYQSLVANIPHLKAPIKLYVLEHEPTDR